MRRSLALFVLVAGCGYDFDSYLPAEGTTVEDSSTAATDSVVSETVDETAANDSTPADTTVADTTVADTMMPDTMMPDTMMPDTMMPDTMMPDTMMPDTRMDADAAVACTDAEGKVFGGHCYFPITKADRYDLQVAGCTARGAHLVTITSAAEEALVETIRPGRDRWIGLRRTTTFAWITGEAVSYTKWEPGKPNGSGDCARLRVTNQWADQTCTQNEEAICERE